MKTSAGSLAALSLYGCTKNRDERTLRSATGATPESRTDLRALADVALGAARDAGASYADIRIEAIRRQRLATREARVESLTDSEDRGFGVRVLADGAWGFAASARIDASKIVEVARRAVTLAKINAKLRRAPVVLAPVDAYDDTWATAIERDPFDVSLADKVALLLSINAAALGVAGVSFCNSSMDFMRQHKFFASTEGSYIDQTLYRSHPSFTVTSVDRKQGSFQTRDSDAAPRSAGYEYMETYPWVDEARNAGEDAVAKHTATPVRPGTYDLILHPSNLWLTIHESVGHPTELDRALGMEANFAGTSFLTTDKMGSYRLGSEIVNFHGEKTHAGSLATCGYDDDGVKTREWPIVERGIFVDYQTTRDQAHLIGRERSHGTAYAQSWADVAFQRMPNINLLPGEKPLSMKDMISDTENGILIEGRGSYSIDQQRYNFQFGGQSFYKIKGGAVAGRLRDVAYQSRTPDFWRACDAICDRSEYRVGGSFYDGKGEPGQSNAVSHGCSAARFRGINVINTERSV